ncbi:MAG: hypothetical protein R3Y63_05790 [Eubacteriales bacterium]
MPEITIHGGVTPARVYAARVLSLDPIEAESAEDGYVIKVYDNTQMHFYCIDNGLNFELLGEWSPSDASTPNVGTPSTSTPSTPATSTPSSGNSSSVEEESSLTITLAIIGGMTLVLCVGVVAFVMKKK